MKQEGYNYGDHTVEIEKMNTLYEIMLLLQEKINKQQIILNKFKEQKVG